MGFLLHLTHKLSPVTNLWWNDCGKISLILIKGIYFNHYGNIFGPFLIKYFYNINLSYLSMEI